MWNSDINTMYKKGLFKPRPSIPRSPRLTTVDTGEQPIREVQATPPLEANKMWHGESCPDQGRKQALPPDVLGRPTDTNQPLFDAIEKQRSSGATAIHIAEINGPWIKIHREAIDTDGDHKQESEQMTENSQTVQQENRARNPLAATNFNNSLPAYSGEILPDIPWRLPTPSMGPG